MAHQNFNDLNQDINQKSIKFESQVIEQINSQEKNSTSIQIHQEENKQNSIEKIKQQTNIINNAVYQIHQELLGMKESDTQKLNQQCWEMLEFYQNTVIKLLNDIGNSFKFNIDQLQCVWNHHFIEQNFTKCSKQINLMLQDIYHAEKLSLKCVHCSRKIKKDLLSDQFLLQSIFEKQTQKLKEFAIQKNQLLSCCNKGCEFWVVNRSQDNRSYYCLMCQEMSCRQEIKIKKMSQI